MALETGAVAPDFKLPGTDGNTWSLVDFNGKAAVIVIFSCNHCPYAIMYEDRIMKLQADYADRGVAVIMINPNDTDNYPADNMDNMILRAEKKNFNFPYLLDESQQSAMEYGATRTPEFFLFDAGHRLAYHGRMDDNADDEAGVSRHELREALEEVLSGTAVSVPETSPVGCTIKWKTGGCQKGCAVK